MQVLEKWNLNENQTKGKNLLWKSSGVRFLSCWLSYKHSEKNTGRCLQLFIQFQKWSLWIIYLTSVFSLGKTCVSFCSQFDSTFVRLLLLFKHWHIVKECLVYLAILTDKSSFVHAWKADQSWARNCTTMGGILKLHPWAKGEGCWFLRVLFLLEPSHAACVTVFMALQELLFRVQR